MKLYSFSANDMPLIRDAFFEYMCLLNKRSAAENSVGSEYPAKCLNREGLLIRKWYERFANVEYSFASKKEVCLYVADRGGETIGERNELINALKQEIKHLKQSVRDIELLSDDQLFEINRLKKENDRLNKQLENAVHGEGVKK